MPPGAAEPDAQRGRGGITLKTRSLAGDGPPCPRCASGSAALGGPEWERPEVWVSRSGAKPSHRLKRERRASTSTSGAPCAPSPQRKPEDAQRLADESRSDG